MAIPFFHLSGWGNLRDIKDYHIADLEFGAHRCRIDWIGAVTYAERHRRTSQPLIEIQLSKVPEDISDANSLFIPDRVPHLETKQIRLPVSFLSFLKIGDIWQEGHLLESPEYEVAEFQDLIIDWTTTSIIKAGLAADNENSFYLPRQNHPYHMKYTQSYCTMVACGDRRIIVPAAEMIRFYFGSSGDVIARIFDVPFDTNKFWIAAIPGEMGRKPKIDLALGISGRSAPTVGRIAFSKAARSAVELIGKSCIAAASNSQIVYPKAGFPFMGKTNIQASGRWLPLVGKEKAVFLVFRLRSCSHPFPFSGLDYTGEGKAAKGEQSGSAKGDTSNRFTRKSQHTNTIVDAEPDRAKRKRDIDLSTGRYEQFPDLGKKRVIKVDLNTDLSVPHLMDGASRLSAASVGDAGKDRSIQPIDFIDAQNVLTATQDLGSQQRVDPTALIFLKLAAALSLEGRFSSVEVVRLEPQQRHDYLSAMPQIIGKGGNVLPWCSIQEADGKARQRKISIGRTRDAATTYYFLVPEKMPPVTNGPDTIELHLMADESRAILQTVDLVKAFGIHLMQLTEDATESAHSNGIRSAMFELEQHNPLDPLNTACTTSKAAYDCAIAFMQSESAIDDFNLPGESALIY